MILTNKPLISICMPIFNDIDTINMSINSIMEQDYENFEVIIVDNQSTDGTYELLQKIAYKNSKIRLFRNSENIGWRLNSNKSLSLANGKYIFTLHGDDYYLDGYFDRIIEIFEKNNDVGIIYCVDKYYKRNHFNGKTILNPNDFYSRIANFISTPPPTNTVFRKSAIDNTLYYSIDYWTSEVRLFMEIASKGYSAYIYDKIFSVRYKGENKDSSRYEIRKEKAEQSCKFYLENCSNDRIYYNDKLILSNVIFLEFINLYNRSNSLEFEEYLNKKNIDFEKIIKNFLIYSEKYSYIEKNILSFIIEKYINKNNRISNLEDYLIQKNNKIDLETAKFLFDKKFYAELISLESKKMLSDETLIMYLIGRSYKYLMRNHEAKIYLNSFISKSSSSEINKNTQVLSAEFHLGELYFLDGDFEKAEKFFEICSYKTKGKHRMARYYLEKINYKNHTNSFTHHFTSFDFQKE